MKIKNEYVTIKSGKKHINLKNTIMNIYLSKFNANTDEAYNYILSFDRCYIKLETPLLFNVSDYINASNFDFYFDTPIRAEELSENLAAINYSFTKNVNEVRNANSDNEEYISKYVGKKITAIGFFSSIPIANNTDILADAILDVSNYDIYCEENFSVTRRDTISTNGIFVSQSPNIKYPVHLRFINNDDGISSYISHIGFGNSINKIDKLYNVGIYERPSNFEDEQYVKFYAIDSNNSYSYIPNRPSFCNSYMPKKLAFYPTSNNYKYAMFVYTCKNSLTNENEYGKYWEVVENEKFGNTYAMIKFERS